MLNPYQRAAAMTMMETNDPKDGVNVLASMVNRARLEKRDLGTLVSTPIYQPTIEPSQEARLTSIIRNPQFMQNAQLAERYWTGVEKVPHAATHFLAPEKTMLALEAREPSKYKSWREWTGFDPNTQSYRGVVLRDGSHAFLRPSDHENTENPIPPMPQGSQPKMYTPVDHNPFDTYEYGKALAAKQTLSGQQPTFNPEVLKPKETPVAQGIGGTQVLPNVSMVPVDHDPWGTG